MSSSRNILPGVAAGVLLGKRATPFGWAADAFVKLLQMTVALRELSIVTSLGSLEYATRTLGIRAGPVLAGLGHRVEASLGANG